MATNETEQCPTCQRRIESIMLDGIGWNNECQTCELAYQAYLTMNHDRDFYHRFKRLFAKVPFRFPCVEEYAGFIWANLGSNYTTPILDETDKILKSLGGHEKFSALQMACGLLAYNWRDEHGDMIEDGKVVVL